ncbi:hypothetical protein PTT_15267 [Pyrenophora teres f. teres 0-1]|uniref:Uncharacterized protein n=1 Tax=Pyrenophora teres f. teres (strain 0-1) TaxID=861557 RepID=E3RZV0_PYRTT|nr:hypothetical protein PTT_15267 [Pyrenophora teres f. teres 0-1]
MSSPRSLVHVCPMPQARAKQTIAALNALLPLPAEDDGPVAAIKVLHSNINHAPDSQQHQTHTTMT